MDCYLPRTLLPGFLLFFSALLVNVGSGNGAKTEESAEPYSPKFAHIVTSPPAVKTDVPPKPMVFEPYVSPVKPAKPEKKAVQTETVAVSPATVERKEPKLKAANNFEESLPMPPQTAVPFVYEEKKKGGEFLHSLTVTASRSKRWFTDNARKVKEIFQDEETKDKQETEKNFYEQGLAAEQLQDYSAAVRLYRAYINQNKIEKSEDENINADIAAPYYRLAMIAQQNNETDSAETYFREAITYAIGRNRFIIADDFSVFLLKQNQIKDAEVVVRNIMIDYPEHPEFQRRLAQCLALQDRPIESLRYFTEVCGGNREKAYGELAQVYRSQNRIDMALVADAKREELSAQNRGNYPPAPVLAEAKPVPNPNPPLVTKRPVPPANIEANKMVAARPAATVLPALPPVVAVHQPPADRDRYVIPFPKIDAKQDIPAESVKESGSAVIKIVTADYSALSDYSIDNAAYHQ